MKGQCQVSVAQPEAPSQPRPLQSPPVPAPGWQRWSGGFKNVRFFRSPSHPLCCIPGRGRRRSASVSPGPAHFHPEEHSEMPVNVCRNQPSKCALVTASPALAKASNRQLNKRYWVKPNAGARRPRPAPAPDLTPAPPPLTRSARTPCRGAVCSARLRRAPLLGPPPPKLRRFRTSETRLPQGTA